MSDQQPPEIPVVCWGDTPTILRDIVQTECEDNTYRPVTWQNSGLPHKLVEQLRRWHVVVKCRYIYGLHRDKDHFTFFAFPTLTFEDRLRESRLADNLPLTHLQAFITHLLTRPLSPKIIGWENKPHKVLCAILIGLLIIVHKYNYSGVFEMLYATDLVTLPGDFKAKVACVRTEVGTMIGIFEAKQLLRKQKLTLACCVHKSRMLYFVRPDIPCSMNLVQCFNNRNIYNQIVDFLGFR